MEPMISKNLFKGSLILGMTTLCIWAQEPQPQRVELITGDVFIAPILQQDDQQVILNHPLAGQVKVPRSRIKQIGPEKAPSESAAAAAPAPAPAAAPIPAAQAPAATQVTAAAQPPQPVPPAKEKGFIGRFIDEWNVQLSIGANYRDSNVESTDINAGFNAFYEDTHDRWKINALFFYAKYDETKAREDLHIGLQKDWLFEGIPWFLFAQSDYDHDEFKSWEHRVGGHGGLGYDFKKLLGIDAKLRGGFGLTREFGGVEPDTRPEGLASSEINWQINKTHSVAGTVQYYPGLEEIREYRLRTTGDWTIKLSPELSLKLGVWDEYDSTEPEGFETNDLRLYSSMVFNF